MLPVHHHGEEVFGYVPHILWSILWNILWNILWSILQNILWSHPAEHPMEHPVEHPIPIFLSLLSRSVLSWYLSSHLLQMSTSFFDDPSSILLLIEMRISFTAKLTDMSLLESISTSFGSKTVLMGRHPR